MTDTTPDDYWTQLAAELHTVADQLATLAGTTGEPYSAFLSLSAGYSATAAETTVPVVDAIASVLGMTATTKSEGRGADRRSEHRARTTRGALRLTTSTPVPNPPTRGQKQRVAELERELAEARAELAAKP